MKPEQTAFRRWYGTLHPSLQLIGLQLWLPLFFIVGFCLCYVAAFHAPQPRDVPVAVIGASEAQLDRLQAALDDGRPGAIRLEAVDDADDAARDVLEGRTAVALDLDDGRLVVASAHQYQVAALVPALLQPALDAEGLQLDRDDLAPLPAHDEYGMVSMYLMLSWCIGGYMVAMFIGLMGAPLRHRTRVAVIVVGGAVI